MVKQTSKTMIFHKYQRISITTILVLIASFSVFSQTFKSELLYHSSKDKKSTTSQKSAAFYSGFSEYFKSFSAYQMPSNEIHQSLNQVLDQGLEAQIALELGEDYKWDLTLYKYDILAPNYLHSEEKDGRMVISKKPTYFSYKGFVNGKKENRVVLTIKDGFVNGFVMVDGIKHNIQSSKNFDQEASASDVVVFKTDDANEKSGAICEGGHGDILETVKRNSDIRRRAAGTCIELAVAYDPGFNNKFGGNAPDEIIARTALLSDWYTNIFNLDIEFKLVETHLETNEEISPANKTSVCVGGDDLLNDIGEWGRTGFVNDHDIGAYWVARDICGSGCGVVGCATISGVCGRNRYNVNEDFFRTAERNTIIWAHEIGHNLGAQHSNGDNLMSASLSGGAGDNFGIAAATRNSIVNARDNSTCLSDPCRDTPPVPDFTFSADFCTSLVRFQDKTSGAASSLSWDFGNDGTIDATTENPTFDFLRVGTYPVKLVATNAFGSNEVVLSVTIDRIKPQAPTVSIAQANDFCSPAMVTMNATGTPPFNWYGLEVGGERLNTGATYSPTLNSSASFYVSSGQINELRTGVSAPTASGEYFVANDLRGLIFNVNESATIRSVLVDAQGAGNRTIELLDAVDGNVLTSKVFALVNGRQRIDLNFSIMPGTGYFLKVTGDLVALYRDGADANITYPITDSEGVISITGTNAGSPGFYYFFYDWVVETGCPSQRAVVSPSVTLCNSLEDDLVNTGLSIFPSPTSGVFTIKLSSNSSEALKVEVRNALGQLVFEDQKVSGTGYERVVDLSGQPAGIYLVSTQVNGQIVTEKLIVE